MEKAIILGKHCVKRGKFWYAIKRPVTSRADYQASLQNIGSNWRNFDSCHKGDNRVIINQR